MRKTLLTISFLAISLTTFAQYYRGGDDSPVTFGIKAGVNLATLQESVQGTSGGMTSGTAIGFHAGVFADLKFGDSFSVQPSLLYTVKGGTDKQDVSEEGFSANSNVKLTINYLELPIYALYHAPVDDNDFFIGAGPFIGYGSSGKEKGSVSVSADGFSQSTNVDDNVTFGSDSDDVKRIDYGVSALVGFKFGNGFLISAFYDFGLANLANEIPGSETEDGVAEESKVKSRVGGLSVGFTF